MRSTLQCALLICVVMIGAVSSFAQTSGHGQLNSEYQNWLAEDVHWIITDQERNSFSQLKSDADRDHFVTAFWERRNPTPSIEPNPFKEEHYRRLAFANQHFAAGAPGWKTDRGRVYIVYGPPDSIHVRRAASATPPQQIWTYRHMQGRAEDTELKFVDHCRCGDYQLQGTLSDKQ